MVKVPEQSKELVEDKTSIRVSPEMDVPLQYRRSGKSLMILHVNCFPSTRSFGKVD